MRKIIFGLAVVAMAATTSAFTNKTIKFDSKAPIQETFFYVGEDPSGSTNPSDYVYDPDGTCNNLIVQSCSALWEHEGELEKGMSPNRQKLTEDAEGAYVPGI